VKNNLFSKFPLTFYFLFSYAGSWIIWSLFVFSKNGRGLFGFESPMSFLTTIALGIFCGPFLSAIFMSGMTEGYVGIKKLFIKLFFWRVGIAWYAFALVGIPVLMLLGTLLLPHILNTFTPMPPLKTLLIYIPFFFYPALLIGGPLAEEPGWRGFALPRLQKKYGPLVASIMLGVLWAFWHMPIWFSGQWTQPTVLNITAYITWITAITIIMTWVFNNTKKSVLMAILLHTSFDAFPNAVLWTLFPMAAKLTSNGALYGYLGLVLGFGLFALLIVILTKGQLSYKHAS
jgi:membrane protease YdiL (CAAX protease family)